MIRAEHPLFFVEPETTAVKARELQFTECGKAHAVSLVREWHSRLPQCQSAPWTNAFKMHHEDKTYAVAL